MAQASKQQILNVLSEIPNTYHVFCTGDVTLFHQPFLTGDTVENVVNQIQEMSIAPHNPIVVDKYVVDRIVKTDILESVVFYFKEIEHDL